MADHSYFANLIWQIADLLRGPYRPPQYERVMLPMTVLRRFDCVLASTKAEVLAEHGRRKGGKVEGEALDLRLNRAAGQRFHNRSPLDFEKLKGDPDNIERHLVSYINGDVIITKDSESWDDIGVPAFVRETAGDLVCGYHLALLRPLKHTMDGAFLFRCLQAKPVRVQLELAANGVTRFGIPKSEIGTMTLPVPPLHQQHAIADYLDRETARLDALVATKERILVLLAEKRRALIIRAVTRGLDPSAPLRDSGVPWLGEIPAHWEAVALRFLVDLTSGGTPDTGNPDYWDGEIPWVSPKDMKQKEITDTKDHVSEMALSESTLRLIEPGAVLIVVRGMILNHSFPVALNRRQVTINQDMKALRCRQGLTPHYLRDFFRGFEDHTVSLADFSTHGTRKLDTEVLGRLEIPVPPLSEQQQIKIYIDEATSRLDSLHSATRSSMDLLKERRAALIAASVTGRIDIGGAS